MKKWHEFTELIESTSGKEINISGSMCDLLGSPKPPLYMGKPLDHWRDSSWARISKDAKEAGNKDLLEFAIAMERWTAGFKNKTKDYTPATLANDIKRMINSCPRTGDWLRYTDSVWRGVVWKNEMLKGFNPRGVQILNPGSSYDGRTYKRGSSNEYWVVHGTFSYKPFQPMQSWTNELGVALSFATGNYSGVTDEQSTLFLKPQYSSLILEYKIPKEDSLNISHLGNAEESEIIRMNGSPANCKAYIIIKQASKNPMDSFTRILYSPWAWKRLLDKSQRERVAGGEKYVSMIEDDFSNRGDLERL
jgi:hypothetical protein